MNAPRVIFLFLHLFTVWMIHGGSFAVDERTVGVFVALCDNVHQGIVPVPKAIGDGDDPDRNLYWGTAEGFLGVFGKSLHWKKKFAISEEASYRPATDETASGDVMRTYSCRHASGNVVLKAFAYRGSAIETCLKDFEEAVHQGKYDLVAYLGHNGLMDFSLPLPAGEAVHKKPSECIVLCCKSQSYFRERIEAMGARPILLTTQFMYPGAFILHDVVEEWIKESGLKAYRVAAGRAYAANQKISQKAALGVFADLESEKLADKASGATKPIGKDK